MTEMEIIEAISAVRASNNKLWMHLLEIALEQAPVQAKEVLRSINTNDQVISDLVAELAK